PAAILWDIENYFVPRDVRPHGVVGNIRMGFRAHPTIHGLVAMLSGYRDFDSSRIREECWMIDIEIVEVLDGRKEAADKIIL
ncbi:Hypothetical predicted protein, partial [Olea europaea subsp. europaea]